MALVKRRILPIGFHSWLPINAQSTWESLVNANHRPRVPSHVRKSASIRVSAESGKDKSKGAGRMGAWAIDGPAIFPRYSRAMECRAARVTDGGAAIQRVYARERGSRARFSGPRQSIFIRSAGVWASFGGRPAVRVSARRAPTPSYHNKFSIKS